MEPTKWMVVIHCIRSVTLRFFWFMNDCCVSDSPPRHRFYIAWIKLRGKSVCTCPCTCFSFPSELMQFWPNTQTFLILKSDYYSGKKDWRTWTEISGEMCVRQYHHCECKTYTTWNCMRYGVHLHMSFSLLFVFAFLLRFLHKTCALKCLHTKHQS